ncbi:MAG TPA: TonB-dependent receptor [Bryobacteraceae bacterium]|nr:TonB-dependent receptor [Bryobacteraceae bacterium]
MQIARPLVLLLSVLAVRTAPAQSLFGSILGTVSDKSQAVVAGANVRIRNSATNAVRVLKTDKDGAYQAPALPVGEYEVSCEAPGFKRALVTRVDLAVDQRARIDIQLEVGGVEQQVEVTSSAPIIETDTASQGTVIDNQRIVELPLNGRNFQQLAVLAPGVIAPVAGAGNDAYFSVAGTRGLSNSFMMDGATNTNSNANVTFINPSIDLIEEFKIQRNTFNAEYGRGAAQINVVTKSGSNKIHLTLFEFLRNDKLNARNFFDGARKPILRRNQFGGTVSGPLALPRIYDGRNKTFWLFNYEGTRQRSPNTRLSTVPVQAQLNGDLTTAAGASVRDPLNPGTVFPDKQIPASRFDPASVVFRKYMPVTTLPPGALGPGINLITPVSTAGDFDQFTIKVDQQFSANSHGFARYTFHDNTNINPSLVPEYTQNGLARDQSALLGHNWVLRPSLINEFRAGFSRHTLHQGPPHFGTNFAEALGLKNTLSRNASFNALPTVNITGFTGLGGSSLITQRINTFSYVDNLTWIHGRHTVKTGVDIRRLLLDVRNIGATNGSFGFTGAFSGVPVADFLLGLAQSAGAAAPPGPDGVNLSTVWQAFVQDDWKVRDNLTLSLGVRYEYPSPLVNNRGQRSLFDGDYPGGRLIYSGMASFFVPGKGFTSTDRPLAPEGLVPPDKNNFAPRFGFAWRPGGSKRHSVRGSYGVFYEAQNANNEILFGSFNYPHQLTYALTNDITRPSFVWSNLFPPEVTVGATSFNSLSKEMPVGYVQQWSLNVQRAMRPNLALEVGYMGSKGTKLDWRNLANQAVPDKDPSRLTTIASRQPYPSFAANPQIISRNGFSNYHALLARLERRFSAGLQFLVAYTYSKSIDNSSFAGNIGAQPAIPQNQYDRSNERGLSYFDVPHRLAVSYVWNLPFGRGKRFLSGGGLTDYVLGGWQLTGITQAQTGNPWSVLVQGDPANVGAGTQRAELVGDPTPPGFVKNGPSRLLFDPKAFAVPVRGTFGNTGRNIIRDAGIHNWDVAVNKRFRLTEASRLEFRSELFNAANHTSFLQFANTVNTPTFGTHTSARPPRILQFALKLIY